MIDFILLFFLMIADALWFGIQFAVIVIGAFVVLFVISVAVLVWLDKRN